MTEIIKSIEYFALLHVLSALFGMALSTAAAPASQAVPPEVFQPESGMQFIVDTKAATGYLVNADGRFAAIPLVLGQNEMVHYLGRTYLATTPEDDWNVREIDTQGDRITFGKEGTFLRLFRHGKTSTPYGIHTHASIDHFLASENHFRSLGCILVTKPVLDMLQRAYEINGKSLKVVTAFGVDETLLTSTVTDALEAETPIKGASMTIEGVASAKG